MKLRTGAPSDLISKQFRIDRSIDELIGLCKGVLADGKINQDEAIFLQKWIEANSEIIETWPANRIYERISNVLADGILDQEEADELFKLLSQFTGDIPLQEEYGRMATALPIDLPPPRIEFPKRKFCLTGTFCLGKRKECKQIIQDLGGLVKSSVTMDLDYLIIGVLGTYDWIHSTYGRKIEKAVKYKKEKGCPIMIVNEDHWVKHLPV